MADVAAKTAKSDITKRSDVLRFAGKLLSVFFVVALLCAVLPTRATGEEPALFRASLMYNDTTNAAGSSVKVALMLVPQDENDDSYNAYQFVLHYDSERLGYGAISATGGDAPEIVEDSGGTLTIAGYGARRTGPSFVLTFNIKAVGDAQVTLTEAYVDRGVNALKDARAAEIATNTVTIHAGGCAVELPDVEGIRQLGADSTILSADCGDPADPPWEYAMAQYLHEMEEHGVSRDALRRMTQTLPAQLLGFENAAE